MYKFVSLISSDNTRTITNLAIYVYKALYYLVLSVICLYVVYPQNPVGLLELNKLTYLL